MEDREFVGLLYRADWTQLTLSGTVRGAAPVMDVRGAAPLMEAGFKMPESWTPPEPLWPEGWGRRWSFSEPPWYFTPSDGEGTWRTLFVAPGRRFRVESADGSRVLGCDGDRIWEWLRDGPPKGDAGISDRPRPPFRTMLAPSWLLSGYSLTVSGPETVGGRAGVRVLATPRAVTEQGSRHGREPRGSIGVVPGLGSRKRAKHWDEVDAVIDAELGILLRCSRRRGDQAPEVIEFGSLDVGRPVAPLLFGAPPGSVFGRSGGARTQETQEEPAESWAGDSLGDLLDSAVSPAVREAAKAVAGIAAGGLGAVIKYGPSRHVDPFSQATGEDADALMPTDEPAPDEPAPAGTAGTGQAAGTAGTGTPGSDGGTAGTAGAGTPGSDGGTAGTAATGVPAGAVSDEVLDLLYRGGLPAPRFAATLHQWFDLEALLDAVPKAARGMGFGGMGFLVDAVRDNAEDAGGGCVHSVSDVRMGGWTRYRIDVTHPVRPVEMGPLRPGLGRHGGLPLTVASDGVLGWHVYADRVERGPATPPPGELADLVDPSWLLEFELSGGGEVVVGGRRAYRVVARSRARSRAAERPGLSWWALLFLPAVAVVDAETGQLLRLTRFKGGHPVLRQELRDIGLLPPDADFAFATPTGVPLVDVDADDESDSGADEGSRSGSDEETESNPAKEAADAIRKQVDETLAAARNALESFFGGGRKL